MSNYISTARSNYFKVKDLEEFKDFCDRFGGTVELGSAGTNKEGKHCVIFHDGIPSDVYDEQLEEQVDLDILQEIAKHLPVGEVAILMECGLEGQRSINGYAMAVNSKGEFRDVGIDSIYKMAEELTILKHSITRAEN